MSQLKTCHVQKQATLDDCSNSFAILNLRAGFHSGKFCSDKYSMGAHKRKENRLSRENFPEWKPALILSLLSGLDKFSLLLKGKAD